MIGPLREIHLIQDNHISEKDDIRDNHISEKDARRDNPVYDVNHLSQGDDHHGEDVAIKDNSGRRQDIKDNSGRRQDISTVKGASIVNMKRNIKIKPVADNHHSKSTNKSQPLSLRKPKPRIVLRNRRKKNVIRPTLSKNQTVINTDEVLKELKQQFPNAGANGTGVHFNKDKLSRDARLLFDEGWQKNAYNQLASDIIPLHRSLPEMRDPECHNETYHDQLPVATVVICFHNEAWSTLLRTVHSVIDRTPAHLLKGIVMVDDFSDQDHLKEALDKYVAALEIVKVVRTQKREGLIRARLLGFSQVTSDVVIFLDSHCECAAGWAEPLLDRIATDERNVVCPVIDRIADDTYTFSYHPAKYTFVGGFNWDLIFTWHPIPESEMKRRASYVSPVRSPTMAGGLFAIHRNFFDKLGKYDPGFDIWGAENLELSFKVWMCGGILEIAPCSRVGHIFRTRSPYKWPKTNVLQRNSVRLAEVWMDEYKHNFYDRFDWKSVEYGDISDRKKLRESLQCKSFDWYIKEVYPDLFIPSKAIAAGEVRHEASSMCLDSLVEPDILGQPIGLFNCHGQGGNHIGFTLHRYCMKHTSI